MINHTEAIAIAQVDIIDISGSKVLYRMYEQQGGPLRTFQHICLSESSRGSRGH